jgi:hypothetical protein
MTRLRFTIRSLMLAVLITALLLAAWVFLSRLREFIDYAAR